LEDVFSKDMDLKKRRKLSLINIFATILFGEFSDRFSELASF